jgi:hypothetical protein
MSTKTQQAMAAAIDALLAAGFEPDGQTREEVVRVPTRQSPVLGYSGGELARFGGRQRFAQRGTNVKATVGPRTTAVYRIEGAGLAGVRGIASHDTSDGASIRATIAGLVPN